MCGRVILVFEEKVGNVSDDKCHTFMCSNYCLLVVV